MVIHGGAVVDGGLMAIGAHTGVFGERLVLSEGTVVLVRGVRPCDSEGVLRFLRRLSLESVYLRFCSGGVDLRAAMLRFTQAGADTVGIVACDMSGEIVGHAEYVRTGDRGRAEVAVVIADDLQGKGLARALIGGLAADASANRVDEFVATVLPDNPAMLVLFRRAFGARIEEDVDAMLCDVSFSTAVGSMQRRAA